MGADMLLETDEHYKTGEGNEGQISVVGRFEPENGGEEYRVQFSDLELRSNLMLVRKCRLCRRWNIKARIRRRFGG